MLVKTLLTKKTVVKFKNYSQNSKTVYKCHKHSQLKEMLAYLYKIFTSVKNVHDFKNILEFCKKNTRSNNVHEFVNCSQKCKRKRYKKKTN